MDKNKLSDTEAFFVDNSEEVASAHECTGLAQAPVGNEAAAESLMEIYDVPLAITDTKEAQAKAGSNKEKNKPRR